MTGQRAQDIAASDGEVLSSAGQPRLAQTLLTARQVAELLGVPQSWVYQQSRAGRIPTVTLGRYRRYRPEAISAWLVELEAAGSGSRGRPVR
jgi:excisionase family DNA binding protein